MEDNLNVIDGGTLEERISELKDFFGLTPDQSFQEIDVDNDESEHQKVIIVNGPVGAGKSTYVEKHANPEDIVIDLDRIATAFRSGNQLHSSHTDILDLIIPVRNAAYDALERKKAKWGVAYIITSEASADKVKKLSERFSAEVITIHPDKEVCIQQIKNDKTRPDKKGHIELSEKWYESRN